MKKFLSSSYNIKICMCMLDLTDSLTYAEAAAACYTTGTSVADIFSLLHHARSITCCSTLPARISSHYILVEGQVIIESISATRQKNRVLIISRPDDNREGCPMNMVTTEQPTKVLNLWYYWQPKPTAEQLLYCTICSQMVMQFKFLLWVACSMICFLNYYYFIFF